MAVLHLLWLFLRYALLLFVLGTSFTWACAAILIDGPQSSGLAKVLCGLFALSALGLPFYFGGTLPKFLLSYLLVFLLVLGWWFSISPQSDRKWSAEYRELPRADIEGDRVTIHNLRNFAYKSGTEFTPRWETRVYDLSKLEGLDFFMSYWGSPYIAHTIMSWQFSDGKRLAVSIETRREEGEIYSAVKGFFRQYELYYVVADERDLIMLRTNYRAEDVYLYRLSNTPEGARKVLLSYLRRINKLAHAPHWYNAVTQNCTSTIRYHAKQVALDKPWDWRMLVNGYLDQLGHERGSINSSMPFEEMRKRSYISERGKSISSPEEFSEVIRRGLPGRPGA